MVTFFLLILLSSGLYALTWWSTGWGVSPDGVQYLRMATKQEVPMPYARRWFVPWLMGLGAWDRLPSWPLRRRWLWLGAGFTVFSAVLTAYYAAHTLERRVLAVLLFAGLPGIWRLNVRLPILVDPAAYCAAIGSALLIRSEHPVLGFLLALIGCSVKETVPLFAAVFAWSPVQLFALAGSAMTHYAILEFGRVNHNPAEAYLRYPMSEARKVHDFFDLGPKLFPWGAVAVLAALAASANTLTMIAAVGVAFAYAQLAVAMDNARLYQWAAPTLIAVGLSNPPWWVWIAAVVGLFNPYRGT